MKDFFGVSVMFAAYAGSAYALRFLTGMSIDTALLFILLYVGSQIRWFNNDVSPVKLGPKPSQSFMSRVRGE